MSTNTTTATGYYMPAEWHKHRATWLSWPHNNDTWHNIFKVEKTYVEICIALSQNEIVNILINDRNTELRIRKILSSTNAKTNNIMFYYIKTSDVWIRDYGPNFIINKQKNILGMNYWKFNAWGEKYSSLMADDGVPERINHYLNLPIFKPEIILEGGSIDVNGNGICITTEQCLLNNNRNPNLSKDDIETYLKNYLGVNKVIWLKNGIVGDDTDGHIDDIARFVNPSCIVCAFEEDKKDINYPELKKNYEILCSLTEQNRKKITVINLPMPKPVRFKNKRLPASYCNFYIANKIILVPIFNQENDKIALRILQELFTDRKIIGVDCRELVWGLGAIHCVTQQEPYI